MVKLSTLSMGFIAATPTVADLACSSLVPNGFKNNHVKLHFYPGSDFSSPSLPANASVALIWTLASPTSPGATFHLLTCNSNSLSLSPQEQSSCSDSGCYHTYTNFVQVINPFTGHCLTTLNYGTNSSATGFVACENANATDLRQIWQTDQQVQYTLGYENLTSNGTVEFNLVNRGKPPEPPLLAWYLSKGGQGRGIEVIQYEYTQDGVFAEVQQA